MRAARAWWLVAVGAGVLFVAALTVRYAYLGRTIRGELGDDLQGPLRAAERAVGFWNAAPGQRESAFPDSLLSSGASSGRLRRGRTMLLARRGDSVVTIAAATDDHSAKPYLALPWSNTPAYVREAFAKRHSSGTANGGLTGEHVLYATALDARTGRLLVRELDGDELIARMLGPIALDMLVVSTLLLFAIGYLRSRARAGALRREQQLMAMRADFIAAVSHELRTPLAQIKLFATLMRDGSLRGADETERARHIIEKEAERLAILVDNVLTHARLSRPRTDEAERVVRNVTDVHCDVEHVIESFAPLAMERDVTIASTVAGDVVAAVDSNALRQILLNLVQNAVKYGPEGQTVTIGSETVGAGVRLTVTDEGPGIAPVDHERIWLPFERGTGAQSMSVSGSGIGLSVVRDLAKDFGGRAWVEQPSGGGARFVVELPSAR